MLEDLSKELILCNTKVATPNILTFLHTMHIDCYHENIIKLLYSIYIKVLALYYIILRANYMDRVASESLLQLIYCKIE
jgi:hypothetical protein